jgi:hypothetical protein
VADLQQAIHALSGTPAAVSALTVGLPDASWRWKTDESHWSLLEIVHHLRDEEQEDFPLRIRLTLQDPGRPWPPIDPEGWALARNYNLAEPAEVLHDFVRLRRANVEWLGGLTDPAWDNTYDHPLIGPLSAGRLLSCWRAHDLLHLRQILQRRWQLLGQGLAAGELDYAGRW